jgi:uncharacterized membrane protein YidH (DUF202 family)
MRIEIVPLVLAVLLGVVGIGLVFDAWAPDHIVISSERRRRPRRERDRFGEALVGFGVLAMAAAFAGRDSWRYSTIVVIAGAVLLLWGGSRNRAYMRGAIRRGERQPPRPEGTRRIR